MTQRYPNTSLAMLMRDVADDVPEVAVCDVTSDSRRVTAGGLFLACAGGRHHGLEYLDDAILAQPAAVVWEPSNDHADPEIPNSIVSFPVSDLGAHVGEIADRFFAEPSAAMRITGVTGTNGKTTVAYLASNALNRLGRSAAYMGTLGFGIGDRLESSALTTPGCITVHRRLHALVEAGASDVVMEVSSHGLDQGRVDGVRFRVAAYTNISRDHLDYHGDFAAYQNAKARLFTDTDLQAAVINIGDDFGVELAARQRAGVERITVLLADDGNTSDADLIARLDSVREAGLRIRFSGKFGEAELASSLWGRFNGENLALAIGILIAHGVSLADAVVAVAECPPPPGRMELLHADLSQPRVVIDFAHTPDALEKALVAVREHCVGDVWCVFGCGGDRDQGKRAAMGAVVGKFADHMIVTNDNPRDESPEAIIKDILSGVADTNSPVVIPDRGEAIEQAISEATQDDIVLVAGKGDEAYQIQAGVVTRLSDRSVARAALGVSELAWGT
jgi:UDP-N-acetylmuramoyl-L-alanyl-D-glutamate--2,6-diaminopimelate ligase